MSGRARPGRADVAFAAAACIVLAGYNNLAGVRPWHRRWYPAVNALAATAALAAAAASGLTSADLGLRRDRLRTGLRLRIGGGRAGRGRVRGGRADPGYAAPAQRPADRRPGPAPARLSGAAAYPGWHRRLGGDRVPRGAPGRAAPGDGRAGGDRGGQRGVRPVAYPADGRGAGGQRARGAAGARGLPRSLAWWLGRRGRARCCRCCGNAPAAWPRRCCCTWPPTARGRWPAPWPGLPADRSRVPT